MVDVDMKWEWNCQRCGSKNKTRIGEMFLEQFGNGKLVARAKCETCENTQRVSMMIDEVTGITPAHVSKREETNNEIISGT